MSNQETKKLRYSQAMSLAIQEEMERDPRVFIMGQDLTSIGGQFGLSRGLQENPNISKDRLRDCGVVETFMVGSAVGAAIGGAVPLVDLTFSDFMFVAGDEIFNKLAKWRFVHGGQPNELPVTVIAGCGIMPGGGAEHNSSLEAHLFHDPGLKVVLPSTPTDMKGLLKSSIRDPDPVVFLPNKQLFNMREQVPLDSDFLIPLGQAATRREGSDATIITYSGSVSVALEAAEAVAGDGIDVEVIDLRTIVPLDWAAVETSVRKTGRAMVVHEAVRTGGVGAEIAARLHEDLFEVLKAPVSRVCGKDTHLPQNAHIDFLCHPQKDEIAEGLTALVGFTSGVAAAS
jgi:acetoin:2,6-dichlorophenolindophenol oxidoreductase subunit beta